MLPVPIIYGRSEQLVARIWAEAEVPAKPAAVSLMPELCLYEVAWPKSTERHIHILIALPTRGDVT